jgi:ComF family protein
MVWGLHSGPLRSALHGFKYRRDLGLAEAFGVLLAETFTRAGEEVDMVVPVPLGKQRLKERGYNQAALLASAFSAVTGLDYRPCAAHRIRETRSQVGLSVEERQSNVSGAFSAQPEIVTGKRLLLIDDVMTTGATLNACALALKNAGAAAVASLTLARAL